MKRSGFTLVETLLALAIFAVMVLFVFGVVRSVLGLWETGERRGRGDLEFSSALSRLRADLQAMHAGPRGWLELDSYAAAPATSTEPAWMLPRLRFLARGDALPGDDPDGRSAIEIAWLLVPEGGNGGRLCRLVRVAQLENPERSLADGRTLERIVREGGGITVLDGVAWARLEAVEADGTRRASASVAAHQPFDFPRELYLELERVSGNLRKTPPLLDEDCSADPGRLLLRGSAPLSLPEYALVEREWMRVSGRFPQLQSVERGVRDTADARHARGSVVWLPEPYSGLCALSGDGRRLP